MRRAFTAIAAKLSPRLRGVLLAAAGALVLAGLSSCSGGRLKSGVYARTPEGGSWKPRQIILFHPSVATDAVQAKGTTLGTRPFMGSEIAAVVHVNMRKALAAPGRPVFKDAGEAGVNKARLTLLGTVIQREYSLKGTPPPQVCAELYRASGADAAIVVTVVRYGPSGTKLELKGVSGGVAEAGGDGLDWTNVGVRVTMIRIPAGRLVWEASFLDSRMAEGAPVVEELVRECVARIMEAFPYRK